MQHSAMITCVRPGAVNRAAASMAGTIYRDARGRFMWSGKPQHSVAAAAGCAGTSCHRLASMFDVGRHASRVVRPPGTGDALAAMCDAAIAEPWMVPVPCSVGGAALLRRLMSARARAPRPESACTGGARIRRRAWPAVAPCTRARARRPDTPGRAPAASGCPTYAAMDRTGYHPQGAPLRDCPRGGATRVRGVLGYRGEPG